MSLKSNSTTSGFVWKTLEQYGVIGIQFILQLILARILEPEVYGVVAIVAIFIGFSNVFIQKGFSSALVQRKEITKEDVSSVFYVSFGIAAFFYGLIFCLAPFVAHFFDMPELKGLLRVMCLGLFPGVYSSIQYALLRREINFKVVFFASITSVGISGGVAIWLAYKGAGVWALAVQQLLYSFLVVIVQFIQCRWIPLWHCNLKRVGYFWSFGWKVLASGLINEIFAEIRTFVIGKMYTKADLSFYGRGRQFPHLLINSVNGSLQAVMLPRLSSVQDNKDVLNNLVRTSISTSYFVLSPLLVLLACCAEPLVSVLLTDKWLPCVPYLQLYCVYYAAWPFSTLSMQAIYAVGKSDVILKIEIIRKVLDVAALVVSVRMGVFWIAAGSVMVELITLTFFMRPLRNNIGYSVRKQIEELLPVILLSILIGIITIVIGKLQFHPLILLLLQITISLTVYILLSKLFRINAGRFFYEKVRTLRLKI